MPAIIVRECQPADVPAITAIYRVEVAEETASFETEPPDEAEMARRRQALVEAGHPYLVATLRGAVVGYAYAGPYRSRPAYRGTVENSVYVGREARRRGIARILLQALIEAASARGYRQMVAVIGDSANHASVALHRACGFADTGTLRSVGWKHGRWLDTVLMQRALGEGDATPGEVVPPR